jgi:bifunctional NMN adenylyltransferase/nudix hydrolase
MQKQYENIIYIGRFQPFHNAHLATIQHAATLAERVIVVIGSANQPRDIDNPFTEAERIMMIEASTPGLNVEFVCVENQMYNDTAWAVSVAKQVASLGVDNTNTRLIGHTKDESSFYLNIFPQWGTPIEMPMVEILDATTIRNLYFTEKYNPNFLKNVVPAPVVKFLAEFQSREEYQNIMAEMVYIERYKKPYEGLPYPVSFNTGDAIVFKSGHVLMVKRRSHPGKGLLAFPGGFLNANTDRSLQDCGIRELYEETGIKVPEAVIRGSIVEEKVFGALNRSRRGRIITTAQIILLDDKDYPGLPKVKGMDDAEKAMWIPVHQVRRLDCFEDHYDILQFARGRVGF